MTHYLAQKEYQLLFYLCDNKQLRFCNRLFTDSQLFSFFDRKGTGYYYLNYDESIAVTNASVEMSVSPEHKAVEV